MESWFTHSASSFYYPAYSISCGSVPFGGLLSTRSTVWGLWSIVVTIYSLALLTVVLHTWKRILRLSKGDCSPASRLLDRLDWARPSHPVRPSYFPGLLFKSRLCQPWPKAHRRSVAKKDVVFGTISYGPLGLFAPASLLYDVHHEHYHFGSDLHLFGMGGSGEERYSKLQSAT